MKFFLVFYGIIYFVYNTREMEENSKKERGAGVKNRGAPKRPSVGSRKDAREMHGVLSQWWDKNAQCGKRQSRDAISGLQRR